MKTALASGDELGVSQVILDWNVTMHFLHEAPYRDNAGRAATEGDTPYDLDEFLSQLG
jgi:hypothetical protein